MIEFRMNNKNLRFLVAYLVGYWLDDIPGDEFEPFPFPEGANTPNMQIGKCTSLKANDPGRPT